MQVLEAVEQVVGMGIGTMAHVGVAELGAGDVLEFHKPFVDDEDVERSCNGSHTSQLWEEHAANNFFWFFN